MPPNLAMVDISALARLSWELYHSCYLISGDAPEGFRTLVTQLASLQGTLGAFRDHVTSNSSFFENVPEDRIHGLQGCLHGSYSALKQLGDLVTNYRDSGFGNGPIFQWDTHREQVEGLRSRIMVYSANLNLYMTSTVNSSQKGLESLILDALGTTPSQEPQDDPEPEVKPSGPEIQTMSGERVGLDVASELDATSSVKPDAVVQPETPPGIHPSNSTSSDSRLSEYSSRSISTTFTNKTFPIPPLRTSLNSPTPLERHLVGRSPASSGSRVSDSLYQGHPWSQRSESLSERQGSAPYGSSINSPITPTSAGTLRQLHGLQLRDQHLRPLRYEPRDTIHQPDTTILEKFELSSNYEDHCQSLSTRDWLRIAIWWQLKARANLANGERPSLVSPRGSTSPSTNSSNSGHQGYVDLLKASYILYDIVLKRQPQQSLVLDENRKLIADLSDGIKEDFSQFISVDIPDSTTISLHNLDIWESVQPDESCYNNEESLLSLENVRYITVELEDAGAEDECVILRAFVNAGIGGKKLRMRTKTAPYMLLLSTVQGESEPKITICNQSGTLCLQRDFTADDLAQLIKISNATLGGIPGAKISEPVTLNFGTIPVSISFQYSSDLGQFINIPKAYFDAVWQREPADSEQFSESVIFKSSVDIFEQLRAPIMKSMNPPIITRSCQVRVLERTFGEVWRSIRRMVISSSMAEKVPTSLEFFMPLCGVQVHRNEMSQSVQIKWSDTGQERSDKTDGNYNPIYSYVYDENSPNIGLDIQFRSHERAAEFEKAILRLTQTPTYSWAQPSSSGSVYDVADVSLDQKQYKAILLLENRLSFRYCSLYYLYRDIDYIYDSTSIRVKFPKIFYVDYISSHVEQLYRATSNMQVFFSHCEKKTGNMEVFFTDEAISRSFMSSLASGYELCFSRRAESLTTKRQSFLGSNKSTKGETEVQLWRKGNSVQLAARWTNNVPDRWLSMSVPSGSCRTLSSRDGNRVEFPVTAYTRGSILNLAVIASGSPKDARMVKKSGPITIYFQRSNDRDDFIATLDGSAQSHSAWKYGHGYDLLGS